MYGEIHKWKIIIKINIVLKFILRWLAIRSAHPVMH